LKLYDDQLDNVFDALLHNDPPDDPSARRVVDRPDTPPAEARTKIAQRRPSSRSIVKCSFNVAVAHKPG
jgi:hypothetical protein